MFLNTVMPTISKFHGILVSMHFRDHNPPHVHVKTGSDRAIVNISNGEVFGGELPLNKKRLVTKWTQKHREELFFDWDLATQNLPLKDIEGLR